MYHTRGSFNSKLFKLPLCQRTPPQIAFKVENIHCLLSHNSKVVESYISQKKKNDKGTVIRSLQSVQENMISIFAFFCEWKDLWYKCLQNVSCSFCIQVIEEMEVQRSESLVGNSSLKSKMMNSSSSVTGERWESEYNYSSVVFHFHLFHKEMRTGSWGNLTDGHMFC